MTWMPELSYLMLLARAGGVSLAQPITGRLATLQVTDRIRCVGYTTERGRKDRTPLWSVRRTRTSWLRQRWRTAAQGPYKDPALYSKYPVAPPHFGRPICQVHTLTCT